MRRGPRAAVIPNIDDATCWRTHICTSAKLIPPERDDGREGSRDAPSSRATTLAPACDSQRGSLLLWITGGSSWRRGNCSQRCGGLCTKRRTPSAARRTAVGGFHGGSSRRRGNCSQRCGGLCTKRRTPSAARGTAAGGLRAYRTTLSPAVRFSPRGPYSHIQKILQYTGTGRFQNTASKT